MFFKKTLIKKIKTHNKIIKTLTKKMETEYMYDAKKYQCCKCACKDEYQ